MGKVIDKVCTSRCELGIDLCCWDCPCNDNCYYRDCYDDRNKCREYVSVSKKEDENAVSES